MVKGSGRFGEDELCEIYVDTRDGKAAFATFLEQSHERGALLMANSFDPQFIEESGEAPMQLTFGGWTTGGSSQISQAGMQRPSQRGRVYKRVPQPTPLSEALGGGSLPTAMHTGFTELIPGTMPLYHGDDARRKAESEYEQVKAVKGALYNL